MASSILNYTFQSLVKDSKNPVFPINSNQIQILHNPIDFYLALCVISIQSGIRSSYKRILISSLYLGEGPLEDFLVNELFKKLEVNQNLTLRMLFDFHRGNRAKRYSTFNLVKPLKANFPASYDVNIGFYKHPDANNLFNFSLPIMEAQGVHHMKIAVFDDNVLMTGANLNETYFTDRQDRYFIFRNVPQLADYLQDLIDNVIDVSYQIDSYGRLTVGFMQMSKNMPVMSKIFKPTEYKECMKNRFNLFRYLNYPDPELTLDQIYKPESKNTQQQAEKDLVTYDKSANIWGKKLQALGRAEDVFNVLKDMPEEFNIVKGNSVWENALAPVGETVLVFPALQVKAIDLNDDMEFMKGLLENVETINLASGYFNLPSWFIKSLSKKEFTLLCASPLANGFRNDGIKHWIPFLYRSLEYNAWNKLGRKNLYEWEKDTWTFHAKGLWAYENSRITFTSIGSSNFASRSYTRDTELQLYLYSTCPNFSSMLSTETSHLYSTSIPVDYKRLTEGEFKLGPGARILSRVFKTFL